MSMIKKGVTPLFCRYRIRSYRLRTAKTEGYGDSLVNGVHKSVVKMSHFFAKTLFVNGTYLLEKDYGVPCKTDLGPVYVNMCGKARLSLLTGYGGGYDRRAVTVPYVVLNYENRSEPALLTAHNRTEICIKYITA